ncbi:DppC ABC-type dipeptide/oligopeptide/nickel transport systems, permease components [Rhabdaerophilaceae bacterium]
MSLAASSELAIGRPRLGLPIAVWVALALIAGAILVAIVGPDLYGVDPLAQNLRQRNRPPSAQFLLGTDHLGRDIAARLITGLRMSLLVAALALGVAAAVGVGLGLAASAIGGATQWAFFGFVDLLRAMPGVLLALVLVAALGSGIGPVALAVGLTFAPVFALVAREAYRRERALPYFNAIVAIGAQPMRVAFRHLLPNITGPIVTQTAIIFPRCIVTESVMSFLGLGAAPDSATWGRMIAQAARFFEANPTAVMAPTLALALLTSCVAILGTEARRRLDPIQRNLAR